MHAARQPGSLPGLASRLHYERHRPEQTTLYRLVQQHAASFIAHTEASTDAELPRFIKDEFDAFLECGILAHGFLRLRCGECGHDKLLAFSCKRRGFCPSCGARRMSQTAAHLVDHVIPHVPVRQWVLSLPIPLRVLLAAQPELVTPVLQVVQRVVTRHLLRQAGLKADEGHGGAVTLIQRFGSAANLNIHLHCLVLDGVYCCDADGSPAFIEADAPTDDELHALLQTVIARLMKMLTRRGVLVEDMGQTYLAEPDADGEEARTLRPLQAAAITYRIAFGPRAGQKVLTLRGAMPREDSARQPLCADIDGFSLHAAVRVEAHDRKRLEQLCRYITRPALSDERVQVNAAGQVELKLKTPWRDGTTHLVLSPLEFMQRLAALVPRPRLHLIRFHGVLHRIGLGCVLGPQCGGKVERAGRLPQAGLGQHGSAGQRIKHRGGRSNGIRGHGSVNNDLEASIQPPDGLVCRRMVRPGHGQTAQPRQGGHSIRVQRLWNAPQNARRPACLFRSFFRQTRAWRQCRCAAR